MSRRYGRRWALVRLSLRVAPGRVVVVTGSNGAGKSTLLRLLATAIRPDGGTARVLGRDVVRERHAVRSDVGLLDHRPHVYSDLSARENLQLVARFRGATGEDVSRVLAEVGLEARAGDPVSTFSAGMRKRLALARVLLQDARLVLLDEPYGELDPPGFALVDGLLARWRSRGTTVLLSTHLLDRGRALGDDAVVLEGGRLAWSGPAADLPPVGA